MNNPVIFNNHFFLVSRHFRRQLTFRKSVFQDAISSERPKHSTVFAEVRSECMRPVVYPTDVSERIERISDLKQLGDVPAVIINTHVIAKPSTNGKEIAHERRVTLAL